MNLITFHCGHFCCSEFIHVSLTKVRSRKYQRLVCKYRKEERGGYGELKRNEKERKRNKSERERPKFMTVLHQNSKNDIFMSTCM